MTARRPLPLNWQPRDIAAFILSVERSRELLRDVELSRPKPTARGLLVSVASAEEAERKSAADFARKLEEVGRRAMATVHQQRFWKLMERDVNFQKLQESLFARIPEDCFDDHLCVLRAIAYGGMILIAPPMSADAPTRRNAVTAARKLKTFRKDGVRLQSYSDDERLWRLLDDLIRELESTPRKPRTDYWTGARAALSHFASVLFELIGPGQVSSSMLCTYAAMLEDTADERDIKKRLSRQKNSYQKWLLAYRQTPPVRWTVGEIG